MPTIKILWLALLAAMATAGAPAALAQGNYPTRPIRLLVPFAPGGGVDVVSRVISQKLGERLGQTILIETKPGAGGAIAVNELMRSDADGHTLLVTTSSHATMPTLSKLPWHPSNDFTPIANIYSTMFVMPTSAANASKFRNFKEFMAYVRANPGKISWGSSGIGGPQHLGGAHFAKVANVDMVHVPYRGNGPMLQALLANEVQLTFDTPTLASPHIQDGKLLALAVTGDRRLPKLPDVPTVRESGFDYSTNIWVFVIGPKGIPEGIQARLNKEFIATLDDTEVRNRLAGFGLQVAEGPENTTVALKNHIDGFAATYGKLIADMGIKAE